jgi:hypothetical protein
MKTPTDKQVNIAEISKVSLDLPHKMELIERPEFSGWQKIFKFPNGFEASIVKHKYSYGLELALMDGSGCIIQHPDITDDGEGHLDTDEASALLKKIAKLS